MDEIDLSSGGIAVCGTAFLFGLLVIGLPGWITDGIMAASGVGLIYCSRRWWRACTRPGDLDG